MKKPTVVGLSLVTVLATLPVATAFAEQSHYSMSPKAIVVNGLSLASSQGFAAEDASSRQLTSYLPLSAVVNDLTQLGIPSQWDGSNWKLQLPSGVNVNTNPGMLGSQAIKVFLNNTPVQTMSRILYRDPVSGQVSTYVPIYYVMKLLQRLNITSAWDGTRWTLTVPNRPVYGGTLKMNTYQPRNLDPALAYDTNSYSLVQQVYDTLVSYEGPDARLAPSLAQSYMVSADGLTYTFHIRPDAKFSNGDAVTSQSFVDEFERVLKQSTMSPGESFLDPIVAGATAYQQQTSSSISGVTTPDSHTLVIKLTKPEPFFLEVLAMPFFSAVDKNYIDKVGSKAFNTSAMMGSGPFELASTSSGHYVLRRNPYYWKKDIYGNPLPYLNQVSLAVNMNEAIVGANYMQGNIDVLGSSTNGVPQVALSRFETTASLAQTLLKQPQNGVYYLGMNTSIAPFNDPKFRVAMEYAIDKNAIVNQALHGTGVVANQPLPPNILGYMSTLPSDINYTYDPVTAKSLLAAAGYQPGHTTVTLDSPNDPTSIQIDQLIASQLSQVGIQCDVKVMDWNKYLNQTEQGKSGFYYLGWLQDYPDASDFLNTLFNSTQAPVNNSSNYSNPQVDVWLNQAQTDTNPQERQDLYNKVTVQVMKDAAWIPLYYPESIYAARSWVHGFYISPLMSDPLSSMWLDPSHH